LSWQNGHMDPHVRANVLRMRPYSPGKPIDEVRRELGLDRIIKLASNENPWGPSPLAVAAIKNAAQELHLYPDGAAYDLRKAISDRCGVPMSQIVVGDGSDEIIAMIGLAMLEGPADEVIVGDPSFVRYATAAELTPCKLIRVSLDANDKHDLQAMAAAVTDRTKLIFIANPNNPTGTAVNRDEFDRFMKSLPKHVVVVLDEAYFEFANAYMSDYPSSQDYLSSGQVVGLRTFSKAYGLAGLRVGFGIFPEWLADGMERIRPPFNVNSLGQIGATAALGDTAHLNKTLSETKIGLQKLMDAFKTVGAKPRESFANFVWADMGMPARPLFQSLLERGVIVRPGDVLGNAHALRVSVGTREELDVFASALKEVMKAVAVQV